MGFFNTLGNTFKALGKSATAPLALTYDLAKTPFDDKDDDFGSVLAKFETHAATALSPLTDSSTLTGDFFQTSLKIANAGFNEVDRGTSAALIAGAHASADEHGPLGMGELFDGDTWSKSWALAKDQSAGQSLVEAISAPTNTDPLLKGNDFATLNKEGELSDWFVSPVAEKLLGKKGAIGANAALADFGLGLVGDPAVVAGKAAGAVRQTAVLGKIADADRGSMFAKLTEQGTKQNLRSDSFDRFIDGENATGRALGGEEIYQSSPELKRAGHNGALIGSLLAQARDLNPGEATLARRRILAVASGDPFQQVRLEREIQDSQAISDQLRNAQQGTTVQAQLQALNAAARTSPQLNAVLSNQLDNLNSLGDVDRLVQAHLDYTKHLENIAETAGTLHYLPAAHGAAAATTPAGKTIGNVLERTPFTSSAGNRALRVMGAETAEGKTLGTATAKLAQGHNALESLARKPLQSLDNRARAGEATTSVFQKGLYAVPLAVTKTVGLPMSVYTKLPNAAMNALRQTHYIGVANLNNWGDSVDQLNSMMRLAAVENARRLDIVNKARLARTETDKLSAISNAEHHSFQYLAAAASKRTGRQIDPGYIKDLMEAGQTDRAATWGAIRGVQYSATPLTGQGLDRVQAYRSAVRSGEDASTAGRVPPSLGDNAQWRVDMISDEHGNPVALPVMSSQLVNSVPLADMHLAKRVLARDEIVQRLANYGETWKELSRQRAHFEAIRFAGGQAATNAAKMLDRVIYPGIDMLRQVGTTATRFWKTSVLFRLGYPMRILADDHMRILAQHHVSSVYGTNLGEYFQNKKFNSALGGLVGGLDGQTRRGLRNQAYADARAWYFATRDDWGHIGEAKALDVRAAVKTLRDESASDGAKLNAQAVIDKHDPEGRIAEWFHRSEDYQKTLSKVSGQKGSVTRFRNQGNEAKAVEAEHKLADHQASADFLLAQMGDTDPIRIQRQLDETKKALDKGRNAFLPDKLRIGEADIVMPDGTKLPGAFSKRVPWGVANRAAASSEGTFDAMRQGDVEESIAEGLRRGAYKSYAPQDPGHLAAWADALNHQIKNSPEAMFFVKNPNATVSDFVSWISQPENAELRKRVAHFAHDSEDWGGRLQDMVDQYAPTRELQDRLAKGHVSQKELERFPMDQRPVVHGQAADITTGRHRFQRTFSNALNRTFAKLSETPTDNLSRNPFFNATYKQEIVRQYELRRQVVEAEGREWTNADMDAISKSASKNALNEVKQLLWDVSAHKQIAHTLRFISPFFAANQEALTRWWRIASDDPSVIRRFTQGFQMPQSLGLVYNTQTGEVVKPGDGISQNHSIMFRVPAAFGGSGAPLDKFIKKMGGGKYWRVNEDGFNLILQNGGNPGVGPLVTVPAEALARKYANDPELSKAVSMLDGGYTPTGSPLDQALPGWAQRAKSLLFHDKAWQTQYSSNITDRLIAFREANGGRQPSQAELETIFHNAVSDTNRDMLIMLSSNVAGFTPAKPTSKYAVIQNGLQSIRAQANATGRDYNWIRDQFVAKYGDMYTALLSSGTDNQGRLSGTPAEVSVAKKYRTIMGEAGDLDPKLIRVINGPEPSWIAQDDPAAGKETSEAYYWLKNTQLSPAGDSNFIGTKSTQQQFVQGMLNDGWDKYSQLTNALSVVAKQQGLSDYTDSPTLVAAKKEAISQLKAQNPTWGQAYDSGYSNDYASTLEGLKLIAKDKTLYQNSERTDIPMIGQYLQLRDAVTYMLDHKMVSDSTSYEAESNRRLMEAYAQIVNQMRQSNSYFDDYAYNAAIQYDPYLTYGEK